MYSNNFNKLEIDFRLNVFANIDKKISKLTINLLFTIKPKMELCQVIKNMIRIQKKNAGSSFFKKNNDSKKLKV